MFVRVYGLKSKIKFKTDVEKYENQYFIAFVIYNIIFR